MELNKEWLGLAGVALGWGLNQCGQWFVFRRDERKAIGRALADLLEVRHSLLAVPKAIELITAKLALAPDAQVRLKLIIGSFIPHGEALTKRYEESVNLVAGANPILAYRLRSQDMIETFLKQMRALAEQDGPQSRMLFKRIEDNLLRHLIPHLEHLIRELASSHGWWTRRAVDRRLKQPFEVPAAFWQEMEASILNSPQSKSGTANTS